MADSTRSDEELPLFALNGRSRIDWWLRQGHVREYFLEFVEGLRPVTTWERLYARILATKPAEGYDHDVTKVFDQDQVRRLYDLNPCWAGVEQEIYGDPTTDSW